MSKYVIDDTTGIVYMYRPGSGSNSHVGTGDISAHLLYDILLELKGLNELITNLNIDGNLIDVETEIINLNKPEP